ncbi:helix-turn-helix domain-containing protein [Enterococcus hulanensis]|uniref:helix-turn-helix domain-containing protein n=1 Tax=Enterococcus hulanensis TaxID=2559929 RepID=UPI001A8D09CA|nr:helix-turn-helix domain-containing protein [Enterococcus hulanensis]MBO0459538.1 helix-turn-helix domain-containing protein [Enterococcus hulanensis]
MAKYTEWLTKEGLLRIQGWARDGLSDEQVAANMGISRSTLNAWKKKFPDISDTLKKGKDVADREVENALFKRAVGYEFTEVTEELMDSGELRVTKKVKKQVAPDTGAAAFWLKNRKPEVWRDKQEVEHTGKDGEPMTFKIEL